MVFYQTVKHIHMLAVALSGIFFLVRGRWMMQQSENLQKKWVKVLPHIIDSLLLLAALTLLFSGGWYHSLPSWIVAKILALIIYIGLGTMALKRGKTLEVRLICFVLAISVFVYMILVAISKSPVPILS